MKGKRNRLRKDKEIVSTILLGIIAIIVSIVMSFILVGITFCVYSVVSAFVGMLCWNISMPAMFGFSKITLLQALILSFTIGFLRSNYVSAMKSAYIEKKGEEKIVNVFLVITLIIVEIISIIIATALLKYSWNNILPNMLKVDLVQINFWQAFGFAFLFNAFFRFPYKDEEKSKTDKEGKEETKPKSETPNDPNDIEFVTGEVIITEETIKKTTE